ncbi:hypothetical protein [Marisediminicola sp. LYQ85]|uniref:hypothetical protein n=1 Tax=Marisediminicola sp. LYQ85 TaxID=3391062 RepID=UPI003982E753
MANLVEKIADSVTSIGAKRSYGDPVTVDGVEMIPVSLVWFGFGAGNDESAEAGGGGGGGTIIPIGAYTKGRDGLVFEPNIIALLAVSIPLTVVAGKALSKVIRALKK